ncbi:MAG: 4Fe-4S binding protein [Verrucomicrobia bacterium]|nr:4Fe-4S binding protein [Verrucomicrobiota bacterium]
MTSSYEFFIDPSRCIGCQACVQACGECETHRGHPMIHLDYVNRTESVQTVPVVCMHCEDPTCAKVCPAEAIRQDDHGIVHSASKPRCIACSNCVLACPFGVPKMQTRFELMMKCDMCYDRTSRGRKPMCATVCPSGALYYGPREYVEQHRREKPVKEFQFGRQTVRTKVNMMTAPGIKALPFDIADFLPFEALDDDPLSLARAGAPDAGELAVWEEISPVEEEEEATVAG